MSRSAQIHDIDASKDKPPASDSGSWYNTCCIAAGCPVACCLPYLAATVCCCVPQIGRPCSSKAQLWMLQHPRCMSCPQWCCYACFDLLYDCDRTDTRQIFFHRDQINKGHSYVAFNKLVVGDPEESEALLTSDGGRGPYLGATNFYPPRLPRDEHGRKVFLLEMDGGVDSDHDAFRAGLLSLLASKECLARTNPNNYVTRCHIEKLEEDVRRCTSAAEIVEKAIPPFLLRSLHWAVLELDLTESEFKVCYDCYYGGPSPGGPTSVLSYLWLSHLLTADSTMANKFKKVEKIYRRSPLLIHWQEDRSEYHNMTVLGVIKALQAAFSLAGLQGPRQALAYLITNPFQTIPNDFVMPIGDREKIRMVLLESNRLAPAVNGSVVVKRQPFSCPVGPNGHEAHFPADTPVLVNFVLHSQNPVLWSDPTKFDPYNRDLWGPTSKYTFFNGVGDAGPRLCPGRDLAMEVMITAVQSVFRMTGDGNPTDFKQTKIAKYLINGVTDTALFLKSCNDYLEKEKYDPYMARLDPAALAWIFITSLLVSNKSPPPKVTSIKVFNKKDALPAIVEEVKHKSSDANSIFVKFTTDGEEVDNPKASLLQSSLSISLAIPVKASYKPLYFDDVSKGVHLGMQHFGGALPAPNTHWTELESDLSLSRLAFYGLGQLMIKRAVSHTTILSSKEYAGEVSRAHYEIDMSGLHKYAVKESFERYGAIAYFDQRKQVIGIWHVDSSRFVRPQDHDWRHVKAIFRSTMVTQVTLKDHLCHVHFVVSNTTFFSVREGLNDKHPVRRLMKPHTYLAEAVNMSAKDSLMPIDGLAHRLFGVAKEDWSTALHDGFAAYRYQLFHEVLQEKNMSQSELDLLPFAVDGMNLWNTIRKYVDSYLKIFYPAGDAAVTGDSDIVDFWATFANRQASVKIELPALSYNSLVDYLTYSIFFVTGYHELVGSLVEYLLDPTFMPAKLSKEKDLADVETYYLSLALIAATGKNMPKLMNDWTHIHSYLKDDASVANGRTKYAAVVKVMADFQFDLQVLADRIDDKNSSALTREEFPFNAFNPRCLESSVSL